ncbi:DUF2132 domain-containing protein [Desulforhopalus vacuolatus]|uniref:VF530 family protein n=1 Tax=Desulforhopalus vacuolatus TaxID=40414 RepID=UPI0019638521|nr:VF530 family protein [Desulforhopalus vacuolatus]MBM9520901.1 DUF2132 domain-containing protein [Desulforhopalus vacuolatus]
MDNKQPEQPKNPLHGVTLQDIVIQLQEHFGWDNLAQRININCFKSDPTMNSSLKFLRRTPWARDRVEQLYLTTFDKKASRRGGKKFRV